MTNDTEFSTARGRKLLKSETNKRVTEEAADKNAKLMQEYGTEIAERAIEIAEHAGRKTVRGGDVKEAVRQLR
ncbi:histone [Halococcus sediminicola]|uniref:histone n=1 Tax=Halococcus sediminicola TaxID=1264579 RepID=UPI00067922F6|nr:histone [Halococcus sediminicola]